jgi:hypothetical protein
MDTERFESEMKSIKEELRQLETPVDFEQLWNRKRVRTLFPLPALPKKGSDPFSGQLFSRSRLLPGPLNPMLAYVGKYDVHGIK